ncbi:hypothetical protein NDU88_003568 [Pleurodeles waltl]|uniref:Uncharacterized protein n=1 Tax=Pleurodeles waltl TaxID=8319 RepID=A0AAV7LFP7_PLEWA|nr:hypothetical protein NDU88_003568 [Pleurodeles waltl]
MLQGTCDTGVFKAAYTHADDPWGFIPQCNAVVLAAADEEEEGPGQTQRLKCYKAPWCRGALEHARAKPGARDGPPAPVSSL